MKKRYLFLLISFFILGSLLGNSQKIMDIETIENGFIIDFKLPEYTIKDTSFFQSHGINEVFSFIKIDDMGIVADTGYPELPQYTIDLHIPENATQFNVEVYDKTMETRYLSRKILPSQDELETSNTFTMNNNYYSSPNSFYSSEYHISDFFKIMGEKGISMSFFPFIYNPYANRLNVTKTCKIKIMHNGSSSLNLKNSRVTNSIKSSYLRNVFENYTTLRTGYPSAKEKYLIITLPKFENTILYFANYKRNIGYDVTMVTTAVTGVTNSSIKNYIKSLYDNASTRPAFVLLVGDHPELPASGGKEGNDDDPLTDLNYARLDGDDYYPDVFLGRISVSSVTELQNIIHKTIFMETNLHKYDRRAVLLSGGGNGKKQFDNPQRWTRKEVLNPLGFHCTSLFAVDGATRDNALEALNDNNTLFIYRGHGSNTSIGSPFSLTATDINKAKSEVFPFGFSIACLNGNFGSSGVCFGESWIRSTKGGVSFFGATCPTNRHTNNVIQERIFEEMKNATQLSPFISAGMISYYKRFWSWMSGKKRDRHMKTYNLLGDPSLFLYGIGCQDNFLFNNNEVFYSGSNITYQASNSITVGNNSSYVINSGSTVNLTAGNKITINKGFISRAGSTFHASIAPCTDILRVGQYIKENSLDISPEYNYDEKESNLKSPILYYPNPVKDILNIEFSEIYKEVQSVDIYTLSGMLLRSEEINSKIHFFNLSDNANGIYILKINYTDGKNEFVKFILNK